MASQFFLVKSLVRRALQDSEHNWLEDLDEARKVLEALHLGQYSEIEDPEGRATRLRSTMGSKTFEWSVPESMGRAEIMEAAERALEWIERCDSVDEARRLLVRRKHTRTDFSGVEL